MNNEQFISLANQHLLGNYRSAPIVFTRGSGCRLEDVDGKKYLDLCAGIAVISVGHCHPELAAAIAEQAARLMHVSNLFFNDRAIELAAEITKRTGFGKVYFCNSGAEANETLLKLARRHAFERGEKTRTKIITALSSFHGRSMGALSMTGQPKYQEGMAPMVGDVEHVPYGDLAALRAKVDARTAAVILEPVQGEGGVVSGTSEYLRGAQQIAHEAGALFLLDEVQTGYGRTGRFLAREWSGVTPDAIALAKGIAGGFPLGAVCMTDAVSKGLPPGSHGTTYGGNALACAAGLAVLRVFDREKLVENAELVGVHLGQRLKALAGDPNLPAIAEARGVGLLRGLSLAANYDPGAILAEIRKRGVLVSIAGGNVIRFSPPLCVRASEIDEGLAVIESVLRDAKPAAGKG
ncbi:MAG TPA: acetylornithine/succinylornithine family transaminase [Polyangiales bacterium]|jgi:predicted acetylornithine/succinylornithine family transaminase|nr:acetylornithine/succinylornithine family transaminase [Polyangiales bacterium]